MNYELYTLSTLKEELNDLKNMKRLIKDMQKPENFTYLDVLHLHNYLDTLINSITHEIDSRNSAT